MRPITAVLVAVCLAAAPPRAAAAQRRVGWRIEFYGSDSRPVARDGILYVGSSHGELHAIDVTSGRTIWVHPTGVSLPFSAPMVVSGEGQEAGINAMGSFLADPWPARRVIDATPVVDQGTVFVASGDRVFYALDARSGAVRWKVDVPRAASGAAVAGGRVFFAAGNQVLSYKLDGKRVWSYDVSPVLPDDSRRGPSVPGVVNDFVYVAAYVEDSRPNRTAVERNVLMLIALDRASGALKWTYRANGSMVREPVVADGIVFVTAPYPEALHAVDATSGASRWTFRATACAGNVGAPILAGGRVVFATDCEIYGLDPVTGQVAWRAAGRWHWEMLGAARGTDSVVLAVEGPLMDELHALDARSGRTLWTAATGRESRLLAAGDSIVYTASGSSLLGIDLRSGNTLWRQQARGEVSSGPLLIGGVACFTSGVAYTRRTLGFKPVRGSLACVDAASGKP